MSGKDIASVSDRAGQDIQQSMGGMILMAFGWVLLTVALTGGGYLAYRYLMADAENRFYILAPLIVLSFTYLAGWVVSLISIRAQNNLIMPVVIKVYTFGVLGGVLLAYFRVIYKIFNFPEEGGTESMLPGSANSFVLLAGLFLLVTLSLLVEKFYLKHHAIILLVAGAIHLILAVYHYVFLGSNMIGLESYDVYYLLMILMMAFLLTRRYRFLRQMIARMFNQRHKSGA